MLQFHSQKSIAKKQVLFYNRDSCCLCAAAYKKNLGQCMERLLSDGLIYKLIKYSDSSAIALAFTSDFGKLKLFIPRAFSKKGGILTLVPGEIDFLKKDSSDLNKLYSFRPDPVFLFFAEDPVISLRLNLIFDIFDNLYAVEQKEQILWKMITRFKKENATQATIYTFYTMLKNAGFMFDSYACNTCGIEEADAWVLKNGVYCCNKCAALAENEALNEYVKIKPDEGFILRALTIPELYKNIKISPTQEIGVLDILIEHTEFSIGKKLKNYPTFKELISSF